ncbi:hypothetical protein [Bacillus sp. S56]|uniref:hypothetical protein n=1 Tax=Bacillus sp. S56 TaxID=1226987 RepID=UPI00190E3164|nr:hypothetical protein [Bacillus sp. S56]MBK0075568.1 hypothetical protein [Bacillus sp. S56]
MTSKILNYERMDQIAQYIDENPSALVGTERHRILNEIVEISVYELPVDKMYFNENNGRIFTEKLAVEKRLGFKLDSKNPSHEKYFIQMLLPDEGDTTNLMNDIKNKGQLSAGLIMPDGKIINANRRRAIKMILNQRTMRVSILPSTLSPKELYDIEFGLQVADDLKKEYKGIDRLFMIEQGIKVGKTEKEMKDEHGVTPAEIRDSLLIIEKIDLFLEYCEREGEYSFVSNMLEHFKDFVKELKKIEKVDGDTFEAEQVFFKLMEMNLDKKNNVVAHRDIRDTLYYASFDPKVNEALTRNIDNDEVSETDLLLDLSIAKELAKARKDNDSILKTINKLIGQIKGVNVQQSFFDFEDNGYDKILQGLEQLVGTTNKFVVEVQDVAEQRFNDKFE